MVEAGGGGALSFCLGWMVSEAVVVLFCEWEGGRVIGVLGDWSCVNSSMD